MVSTHQNPVKYDFHSSANLVRLDSFPNLQYLTYGSSGKISALWYAAEQLKEVSSLCNLFAVAFDTRVAEGEDGLVNVVFTEIDELLCGDNLPSLQAVLVHETIPFDLLPRLRAAGRLKMLNESSWKSSPVQARI